MLDLRFIRENPETVRRAIRAKQLPAALAKLDKLLLVDEEHRLLRQDLEEKQAQRNASSKEIGERKRRGEQADELIREMGSLSAEVKRLEEKSRVIEAQLGELQLEMPNLPHESVPYGESEHDNVVVFERGEAPTFDFDPRPHWELAVERGWIDFEAGVRISGAGFPVFRGQGARLLRALERYFLDRALERGYEELIPPLLVNPESARATGQLPDKEGQMYRVEDGLYLVPTSELALANMHRGEILDEALLPVRYVALTPCFRREAGSHGKEVRGLNRVHQFDKVEVVQFTHPERSFDTLEQMTAEVEALLEELGLRYRRLLMCSGDMGFTQAKKYDLEVWSAGQGRWLEVSSVSNITDFQAQRLQTRFRPGGAGGRGRPEMVHTLNGSALALARPFAAILEHYQQADGSVLLPEVLRPYMGADRLS